jgi:hypothetical protein
MTPTTLVEDATAAFLCFMPILIGYRILTGTIWLGGLIYERDGNGRLVYSPARLQLLLVTLTGVVQYLFQFTHKPNALPGIDSLTLAGLGGSQFFYLASKAWSAYQARKN